MKCAKGEKSATNRKKSGKKEKYGKKQNSILWRKSNVFLFKKTPKRWKMEAKIYEI